MYFSRSKSTLDSLKSVFNPFCSRKLLLGSPESQVFLVTYCRCMYDAGEAISLRNISNGLFIRREGYPCARVTLASGLKLALVYRQISQVGLPYQPGQLFTTLL